MRSSDEAPVMLGSSVGATAAVLSIVNPENPRHYCKCKDIIMTKCLLKMRLMIGLDMKIHHFLFSIPCAFSSVAPGTCTASTKMERIDGTSATGVRGFRLRCDRLDGKTGAAISLIVDVPNDFYSSVIVDKASRTQ